ENEKFMNAAKFNKLKHGAYFINTSRGELVDEDALLAALQSKKIKGAALDVLNDDSGWSGTVQGSFNLLNYARQHQNLLLTPHMGGYGKDSIARTREFVTDKFLKFAANETDTNS
ncbi:MAG TPA: NAD(P)-dependent oxidoreductase, partial [Bacteroidia bacterium]|nr:NAD(P)-dependent oxidoreductase [Bacteroidia bacterium]